MLKHIRRAFEEAIEDAIHQQGIMSVHDGKCGVESSHLNHVIKEVDALRAALKKHATSAALLTYTFMTRATLPLPGWHA